ncbi:MAG: methyltransferase domain-containing protein [Methanobacteriota archaeon]|nr:MAG: methyltransferase domain-containing protein [Euryarchaeota archaeon]
MKDLTEPVKKSYGDKALKMLANLSPKTSSNCCGDSARDVMLPPSFGCVTGFVDLAKIEKGQVVVDLGSGPGHDAILAAKKVDSHGKVIGVDFLDEMIELAQKNASGYTNVSFIKGDIRKVPLEDSIADVVLSNCVINLVDDKFAVFKEAYRLLRKGGRIVVADMITKGKTDQLSEKDFCACIGGAVSKEVYLSFLQDAGFDDISYSVKSVEKYKTSAGNLIEYESVVFSGLKR